MTSKAMADLAAALARVPSPVERHDMVETEPWSECRDCGATTFGPKEREWHHGDCWWPPFVAARDALAQRVAELTERVSALKADVTRLTASGAHPPPPSTAETPGVAPD